MKLPATMLLRAFGPGHPDLAPELVHGRPRIVLFGEVMTKAGHLDVVAAAR